MTNVTDNDTPETENAETESSGAEAPAHHGAEHEAG